MVKPSPKGRSMKPAKQGPRGKKATAKSSSSSSSSSSRPRQQATLGLASLSGMSRSMAGTSHRLIDHDLIANVATAVSSAAASIRIPCNPRFWPNTKAYQESLGFQCYCPRSMTVHWRPAVAATTAGQVVGGSLTTQEPIAQALLANALMSVPGSVAGPVWKEMDFKFDLSVLTQPKYYLNSIDESGIPTCMFIILPSTAVGMIEITYDIEVSGHCTVPVNIPVYDLIPRTLTMPADMTTPSATLGSGTGLVAKNAYEVVLACAPALGTNIQLTTTSGGSGPILIDLGFFNSILTVQLGAAATTLSFFEGAATSLYLNTAGMENEVTYVWLQGVPN